MSDAQNNVLFTKVKAQRTKDYMWLKYLKNTVHDINIICIIKKNYSKLENIL